LRFKRNSSSDPCLDRFRRGALRLCPLALRRLYLAFVFGLQGVFGAIGGVDHTYYTYQLNDAVVLKNALRADVPRTTVILVPRETLPHCSTAVVQPFLPIVIDIVVR
jgi:hypothetical protein